MYSVRADHQRNRLYLVLRGHLHDDEALEAAQHFFEEARKLREGFVIVDDLSEFRPASPLGDRIIETAHKMVARLKPGHVVTVAGEISERLSEGSPAAWRPGCRGDVVATLVDAERTLSN